MAVPRWCRRRGSSVGSCVARRRTSRHGRPSSSRSAARAGRGRETASVCPSGRTDVAAAESPRSAVTHRPHSADQLINKSRLDEQNFMYRLLFKDRY